MLVCYRQESECRTPEMLPDPPLLGKESAVPHGILLGDAEDAAGCSPGPMGFMLLAANIKANKGFPKDGESKWILVPVLDPLGTWLSHELAAHGCCKRMQLNVRGCACSLGNAMGMVHSPYPALAHRHPPSPPAWQNRAKPGSRTWHLPSTAARS